MTTDSIHQSGRQCGGDIQPHSVFANIISIGYEIESSSLAKLTKGADADGETVFFNTDTARKDIEKFLAKASDVVFEDADEEEDYTLRQSEVVQLPAYDNDRRLDTNISFLATNDVTPSKFVNQLAAICDDDVDKNELYTLELVSPSSKGRGKTAKSAKSPKSPTSPKTTIAPFTNKEYPIRFLYWYEKPGCHVFSDIEWIVTYYRPKQNNPNIILDTFLNALKNLFIHLHDVKPIEAYLTMTTEYTGKIIVNKPEKRILFHKPNTNLYYLQTHYETKAAGERGAVGIDDICTSIQMTFASNIRHTFAIMKELTTDRTRSITSLADKSDGRLERLNAIEVCVLLLLNEYNASDNAISNRYPLIETEQNTGLMMELRGYLCLFMYKMSCYFNVFLQKQKLKTEKAKSKARETLAKRSEKGSVDPEEKTLKQLEQEELLSGSVDYFKNSLYFNCRHTNYALYVEMKSVVRKLVHPIFAKQGASSVQENKAAISILRHLMINPTVLLEHLLDDPNYVRKNAFSPRNILAKDALGYGDPAKSLHSYFAFFEDPLELDNRGGPDDSILYYDWFEYKRIDKYSSKESSIHDNVILVESRSFYNLLSTYLYHLGDATIQKSMKEGMCNLLHKYHHEDMPIMSLGNLKKIMELSRGQPSLTRDQSRRRRVRKRRQSRKKQKRAK